MRREYQKGFRFAVLLTVAFLLPGTSTGQNIGEYVVAIHADLVKTDNVALVKKAQFGAEVNYFFFGNFGATTGVEVWTANDVSLLLGMRWYPSDDAFVRVRGLVGENDVSIGGGWAKPVGERFRFEAIGDFYFKVDFAIRAGFVYVINPQRSK